MLHLSPSEQFDILTLVKLTYRQIDFSLNNFLIMNLLLVFGVLFFNLLSKKITFDAKVLSHLYTNEWTKLFHLPIETTTQLIVDIIADKQRKTYFPILLTIFLFIFLSNVGGLVPYSFTNTSHICVTLFLSITIFIGINVILIRKYEEKAFSLFIPAHSDLFLAFLLVPIEFVSYLVRPISLGVRLFVNLMSGHTLMKVIIGFSWTIMLIRSLMSIILTVPMLIVIVLFILELSVALIQTYVFTVLSCIYIQDIN